MGLLPSCAYACFYRSGCIGGIPLGKVSGEPPRPHSEIPAPAKFLLDTTGAVCGWGHAPGPPGRRLRVPGVSAAASHIPRGTSCVVRFLVERSISRNQPWMDKCIMCIGILFWSSPDGRYVGLFSGNKSTKHPATGGPASSSFAHAPNPRGGTWGTERHDRIEGDYSSGLMKSKRTRWFLPTPATLCIFDKTRHSTHAGPGFRPARGSTSIFLATNHSGWRQRAEWSLFHSVPWR